MRVVGHALRLLLMLAVIAATAWWGWPRLVSELSKLRGTEPIEGVKSTISYVLPEDGWLEFPVDRRSQIIRVLSTANTLRSQLALAEPGTSYAIRYQLLDRAGRVLVEQTHHHGTDIARGIDLETGEFSLPFVYRDPTIVPLRSQRLLIGRELSDRVTRLRLQLAMRDPSISDVVVRAHLRAGAPNRKGARLWPRLRQQQRELLASASVYGEYLLSDEEKEALLRLSWKPMGTAGIEAQDYVTRRLYFAHTADDTEAVASGLPTGMFVRDGLRAVVPVPPRPVPVTLRFETSSVDATDADPHITIDYYGKHNAHQRYTLPLGSMTWEASLDGGWLQVSATSIVTVRAFLADGSGQEITPRPRYLRTFAVAPGKPIEYWIDHIGEHDTAFRIDLRTRDDSESPAAEAVRYTLLDAAGQVVAQGELRTGGTISYYDRAAADAETRLSESTRYFFKLSAQVTRLRLSSDDGEALISGYSRPPGLAHELVVPRDYIPFIRQHSAN
ncbi:MAG: hypothetical protein OEQ39_25040, partial [Gammaproteobacteria bacterium]|nr:hypothetical protein [Gammaproteobacteria bacterium]